MTTRSPVVRTGDIQFAAVGCLLQIMSPLMTTHTAQVNVGPYLVPWRAKIERAFLNVIEASGTAAGSVEIGTVADDDAFLQYSVTTTHALGQTDITASLITTDVPAGTMISFSSDGAATTTGVAAVLLILVPWYG